MQINLNITIRELCTILGKSEEDVNRVAGGGEEGGEGI